MCADLCKIDSDNDSDPDAAGFTPRPVWGWGGAWVARLVERPASAQVMISCSSPVLGSVLTARSLEHALDPPSPSLSAPPLLVLSQN